MSPERTTLQGNPENHRCLLRRAMLFPCASLERGSSAAGGGSCRPWRDRSPAWGDRGRGEGRSSTKTTGPRGKGYLLNSNGIILFGRWLFAKFLIKESLETVCFFNKSLNKQNKTLPSVNIPVSGYKLQVYPGKHPAKSRLAPKVCICGSGNRITIHMKAKNTTGWALGDSVFVNNTNISLNNNPSEKLFINSKDPHCDFDLVIQIDLSFPF